VARASAPIVLTRWAAQSQKLVRPTLSDSQLHCPWIKTLNENPNLIGVANEANVPILESVGAKWATALPFAKRGSRR
jgi:hypothetical protein